MHWCIMHNNIFFCLLLSQCLFVSDNFKFIFLNHIPVIKCLKFIYDMGKSYENNCLNCQFINLCCVRKCGNPNIHSF